MRPGTPARVTMVVPCYNEARRLDGEAFRAFAPDGLDVRFLFVDDGSTDGTADVIARLCEDCPKCALLRLTHNSGKGEAVRQGILQALPEQPDAVGYWDADLSTPLDGISDLYAILAERPEVEAVLGARVRLAGRVIERRELRHYFGRVFATFASLTLGLGIYDTQCGAKLFRVTPRTRALFEKPFLTRWVFDVEILARMRDQGSNPESALCEFPLREWREKAGGKVRPWDLARGLIGLARIRLKHPCRRRHRP